MAFSLMLNKVLINQCGKNGAGLPKSIFACSLGQKEHF